MQSVDIPSNSKMFLFTWKMCLHSCILFLAMYICRPHIYIIVSCFEVMDQYLHKSMNRMCGEEISCGTILWWRNLLWYYICTCTMLVQKPSRAAAICLGYFVPSACPCFGQISLLARHGGLCTTDCLGLMALGVITWWSRVLDIVILFRLWH